MLRSQKIFIVIILTAILLVVAGVIFQSAPADENDEETDEENGTITRTPTPADTTLELHVAVTGFITPWIENAAETYNRTNTGINGHTVTVRVTSQESLDVWKSTSPWSVTDHPQVWIPESSYSLGYGNEVNMHYTILEESLAHTPLIWGAYESRASIITARYGSFSGDNIQAAATAVRWDSMGGESEWNYIKIGFARPDRQDSGFAALMTLSSEFTDTATLTADNLSDPALREWLQPIIDSVDNFSVLGSDPAAKMAETGQSTAEIALLPENQWLLHYSTLSNIEPILLAYPDNYILLNFPYAIWSGTETTADERRAAEDFAQYLLSDEQQQKAGEYGLRPAALTDLSQFNLFQQGQVQTELSGNAISLPNRAAVLNVIRWFASNRTAP